MDAVLGPALFYACGALAVGSAVVVIGQGNAVYSAFALIVTLCSLSVIYALLGAPFIAVLQVVVYAGAIMVLILFVIMLLNVQKEADEVRAGPVVKLAAAALAVVFVVELGTVVSRAQISPGVADFDASTRRMADVLFSGPYLYVFEATSVLILAALVGAVVLSKRDL